ncbi:permease for cytosine/purines, uracil, thiamine, allantoin-domain-containing protein [Phyllosticta citrichinensis]|uniref:Permease for cytosine/purines, uracil, thiamine, allantoin-domain-containing protein n=1 Tax=Phyllosticta citrichinensis TaxID=1130410 RepID=A0ABR1XTG7_9PEZI
MSSLRVPGAPDPERGILPCLPLPDETPSAIDYKDVSPPATAEKGKSWITTVEATLTEYNFETRGIQRVEEHERHDLRNLGYSQVAILWFAINLAANNITLGMLGPSVYSLGFKDSCLCAVFGMMVGCLATAYTATFGPRSGNRTMIFSRYSMGFYPSKVVVSLNIIVLLGYSLIDCVVAGQVLSHVSSSNLSIVVGIVIVAIVTWFVTTFGYSVFHMYEKYAWFPQLVVLSILAGVAGPKFDTSTPSSAPDTRTLIGNRISFFSLCLSAAVTYSGEAGDYLVYYPSNTPGWKVFAVTYGGLTSSFTMVYILGIGLASGMASNPDWAEAYETSQGALIVEAFAPLGGFGKFCGVVIALGLISNLIPPTYSAGVDVQILGSWAERVPRALWNTAGVIIYTICAAVGRAHLSSIFTNFLALMGYWVCIWIALTLEEHVLFRWKKGYDWTAWNKKDKLPMGYAAFTSFVVGWVGAIMCMAQVWYIGPIAKQIGQDGGDLGNYVGFAFAAVVYPPLRWLELKRFGR